MLDAWSSWDVPYAIKMARRLEEFNIRLLEEPVLADKLDSYVQIQRASPILISGGEHEYTRWGFRYIVENRAMQIRCVANVGGIDLMALGPDFILGNPKRDDRYLRNTNQESITWTKGLESSAELAALLPALEEADFSDSEIESSSAAI